MTFARLFAFAALMAGCATPFLPPMNVLEVRKDETHVPTYNGLSLRSGQLILTESPDATSYVFPLIPKKFYPFTHVAILSVEGGEPWVYDVTGGVSAIPLRRRMLDNVSGKMYRRRLFEYVAPNLHAEIYDPPPGADGEKIASYARAKFAEGVEFDSHFDFHDHTQLFCTELVALAVESAGGPAYAPEPSNPNPSIVIGMKWLGVPPGEALPAGLFAEPARFVAALGPLPTRTAAWSFFEAKRELHRRFTMDQRLGYMLSIDGNGQISVRPEIAAFTDRAARLFDGDPNPPPPGDPRIEAAVRHLADASFGPFPNLPTPVAMR
jgi:hypothetical protein